MKTWLLFPALVLSGLLAARPTVAQQVVQPPRPQPPSPQPPQPAIQPPRPPIQPQPPRPPVRPQPPQPVIQPPRPPIQPQPPRPPIDYNQWRALATLAARQPFGQAGTVLNGPYTNFRYLKLKTSNVSLSVERLTVSFDYGPAITIPVHYRLVPGSDHHIYRVQRTGNRRIRRVDFSYRGAGPFNRANVTILGLR